MLMSLGLFVFELDSLPFQELARNTGFRHAQTNRVGVRPANQFLGEGEDTLNVSGNILPELVGDPAALDTLRDMGKQGEAWPLVDGSGGVHGSWVIDSVADTRSLFFSDGAARKYDFQISLHLVDDPSTPAATGTPAG